MKSETMTIPEYNKLLAAQMSEDELLGYVINCAKAEGWLIFHPRPARKKDGTWYTATQGDKGYPDLTLVHRESFQLLIVELKSSKGKISPEQEEWINTLRSAATWINEFCRPVVDRHHMMLVEVWRPIDLLSGEIEQILKGRLRWTAR